MTTMSDLKQEVNGSKEFIQTHNLEDESYYKKQCKKLRNALREERNQRIKAED